MANPAPDVLFRCPMLPQRREIEAAVETPRVPPAKEARIADLHEEVRTVIVDERHVAPPTVEVEVEVEVENEALSETRTRVAKPAPGLLRAMKGATLDDELARLAKAASQTQMSARPIELVSEREIAALSAAFQAPLAERARAAAMASFTAKSPSSVRVRAPATSVRARADRSSKAEKTLVIRQRSTRGWIAWLLFATVLVAGGAGGIAHWHVALHVLR
jgi:hypothetical protein